MHEPKICQTCGRPFEWRKKWEAVWDEVKYCSSKCSKNKPKRIDKVLEQKILDLAATRLNGSTLCPSEATRAVFPEEDWKNQMERTRQAARRLFHAGKIEILQKGKIVSDPSNLKGPIRLRKSKQ